MYNFIRGVVAEKHPTVVVIDVGGIGYEVSIPLSTFTHIPSPQQEVQLHAHLHIKEDAWRLFGFFSQEEKDLFKLLISISGIGPKIGLTILSGIGIINFKKAVKNNDVVSLTAIAGVGKKTAERIIVELKEKIDGINKAEEDASGLDDVDLQNELTTDSLNALMSLGYKRPEAQTALRKALKQDDAEQLSVEELIRHSLTYI